MFPFPSHDAGKSVDNLPNLSPSRRNESIVHSNRAGHGPARPASRRNSTTSSIHSVGGALDRSPVGWASSALESGQNAISTLLQPPIVRTGYQPHTVAPASSTHKPPTARDISPVALTNVAHVDNEDFAPYLSQVGHLYEQLKRVKESEEDTANTRRGFKQDEQSEGCPDGYLQPSYRPFSSRRGSSASVTSLGSIDAPALSPARRPKSLLAKKASQGPPPLSTIPNVYFEEDFHLENPRTFDVVSERSEVIRAPGAGHASRSEGNGTATVPRKALATNAILQEKLSWYMDTIEVHLINSISTASTTFFSALGSLKELHVEAADSVKRISALRKELEALDGEIATSGLQIVQKRGRQEKLRKLNDAVWQLRQIVDGIANCESLVEAGEVDKALASIDSLERLIVGEREQLGDLQDGAPVQLCDLSSAAALEGVKEDLQTLRFRAGKAHESQFSAVLIADLRHHVESVSKPDVLVRWSQAASRSRGGHTRAPSAFPTYLSATEELKAKLLPSMAGLHRANHMATAAMAYREAVLLEVRSLIRRPMPSSNEDDDNESMVSVSTGGGNRRRSSQEKSASLARSLRAMSPEDAEELVVTIYVGVTETLRRLTTQVKVLLDLASSLTQHFEGADVVKSPPMTSPVTSPRLDGAGGKQQLGNGIALQEELHKTLDEPTLLTQAVDIAHDKIVKILRVRFEQTTHLPLALFLRYFTINLFFANECEAISSRSGTSLKTVVNGQIKDFVQRNRDAEMQKLAQGMESDQWNAKDFTERDSKLLVRVLECSTRDDAAWTDKTDIWVPYQVEEAGGSLEANGTSRDKTRPAVVESDKFIVPKSAILCLEGVGNFLQLVAGIPSMTADVASSLVAYLQLFNSRCTQLILGAGATRSAGLKNITTKHLALASQALAFIATIVPHAREFVRRHAGSGGGASTVMGEFDKVRRLLQEHQESIHQKLVDIMIGRAAVHAKSIKGIDWSGRAADSAHAYMETLTKETTTLHRVLTKHLPERSIHVIMEPVFASYKDQLGAAFKEAAGGGTTCGGQSMMLRDVELLSAKLGKIDGFGDTGDFLARLVKANKQVKDGTAAVETGETANEDDGTAKAEGEATQTAANEGAKEKP